MWYFNNQSKPDFIGFIATRILQKGIQIGIEANSRKMSYSVSS